MACRVECDSEDESVSSNTQGLIINMYIAVVWAALICKLDIRIDNWSISWTMTV